MAKGAHIYLYMWYDPYSCIYAFPIISIENHIFQLVWGWNVALKYSTAYFYLCDIVVRRLCIFNLFSIDFSIFAISFFFDLQLIWLFYSLCSMRARTASAYIYLYTDMKLIVYLIYFIVMHRNTTDMHIASEMCSINGKFIFSMDFPVWCDEWKLHICISRWTIFGGDINDRFGSPTKPYEIGSIFNYIKVHIIQNWFAVAFLALNKINDHSMDLFGTKFEFEMTNVFV